MFISKGSEYASRFNRYVMARRWVYYPLLYAIIWLIISLGRWLGMPMTFLYTFVAAFFTIAGTFVIREFLVIWQDDYQRQGLWALGVSGPIGLIVYLASQQNGLLAAVIFVLLTLGMFKAFTWGMIPPE